MTERDSETGNLLVQSIASDNLGDLLGGIGEIAIDSRLEGTSKNPASLGTSHLRPIFGPKGLRFMDRMRAIFRGALDKEVIREIPILGFLIAICRDGRDIRNEFFLRKVQNFLAKISEASHKERQRFAEGFENDAAARRFGESALLLLERADRMEKPKIFGRIMCAAIRGQIDIPKAMRLGAIVDRCYLEDLDHLPKFESGPHFDKGAAVEALQYVGLLSVIGEDYGHINEKLGGSSIRYILNEYGELLIRYGLHSDA